MHRIRLFRNDWLEKLTVISPVAFMAIWCLVLTLLAFAAWGTVGWLTAICLFAAGLLFWSLFEYAMHRFLFHWEPSWTPLRNAVFVLHGNHHDSPDDRLRNLMPPVVSLPIVALTWLVWIALAGPAGSWVCVGFVAGYVSYDLTHFACHQRPMRGRIAQMVKRHHMRHHHVDQPGNFAMTAIFWDRVFGTSVALQKPAR